jgi:hypothetical protein
MRRACTDVHSTWTSARSRAPFSKKGGRLVGWICGALPRELDGFFGSAQFGEGELVLAAEAVDGDA